MPSPVAVAEPGDGDVAGTLDRTDVHPLSAARVLVLDDEEACVRVIERSLTRAGYRRVTGATRSVDAVALCDRLRPDLVLLDMHMPGLDGFGVLEALSRQIRGLERLPVIVLTGDGSAEVRRRALALGARDFVNKPVDPVELLLRIRNLLTMRDLQHQLEQQSEMLEQRVEERASRVELAHAEMLERLGLAAEYHDDESTAHAERVARTSALVAAQLRLGDRFVQRIRAAAPLHDVGKIGLPPDADDEVAKSHVTIGGRLLGRSRAPLLRMASQIALTHHEHWDGTGYPFGLAGESIPLCGRIVALADTFDGVTRSGGCSLEDSLAWLIHRGGRELDPQVVDAFRQLDHAMLLAPADDAPGDR